MTISGTIILNKDSSKEVNSEKENIWKGKLWIEKIITTKPLKKGNSEKVAAGKGQFWKTNLETDNSEKEQVGKGHSENGKSEKGQFWKGAIWKLWF